MEPDVLSTLSSYLQSGGSPRTAIRLLSDNYRGYADTINLLEHWLTLTDDEQPAAQPEQQSTYATEAFQQLVMDSFDPAKADSVFATFDAMPAWLAELLALEGWRSVMERLQATYPQSLFVSFAVRATRASEEAATGQTELSIADIRARLEQALVVLIAAVRSGSSTVHSQLTALVSLTSQSESAYLYTQYLLQLLSKEAGVAALLAKRMSEDVSIFASSLPSAALSHSLLDFVLLHSPRHSDVSSALLPFYRSLSRCPSADLTLPLLSSSLPRLTPGDVHKLYTSYSSHSPAPVTFLHFAPLLCSLVHMLFDAECTAKERQQIAFLLCYASTSSSNGADGQLSSLLSSLTSLLAAVNNKSWLLSASSVLVHLRAAVHSPLLSSVALFFIHNQLTSSAYFDSPSAASFTPQLLSVAGELITACPLLHPAIFATLSASFSLPALPTLLDSLALISYRKLLVLLLLHLLLNQHVLPVLAWAKQQLAPQDHSLVRAFVLGVMGGVAECGSDVRWLSELAELVCLAPVRAAMRQWTNELSEAVRSERWRRLMADKRLGKTDAGRKRLRRMGADDDDDPDWQPDEEAELKKKPREDVRSLAAVGVEVKRRSFLARDTLLDAEEDEVREDVRHFGRLVVGVHARLSVQREKGELDEQGEQVLSDVEKLFVVLQET